MQKLAEHEKDRVIQVHEDGYEIPYLKAWDLDSQEWDRLFDEHGDFKYYYLKGSTTPRRW